MRFTVSNKTLHGYASAVARAINSKNALQILNNFLISLDGNMLTITGSDTDSALSATFEVIDAEGEGKFCIEARRLVDLLKERPDVPVSVNINEDTMEVTLTYPSGLYQMTALSGDQYPAYDNEDKETQPVHFTMPGEPLLKGIENTLFAIGTDDFHPQMMGICFDIKPDSITFVATDTRKLVRYITTKVTPGVELRCIVPAKPANILKSLVNKDEDVDLTITQYSASFVIGNYTYNCRFIKSRYPEYNRVIPENSPYTLRVNRTRFLNAVRSVGIFVDPGYGMEKFRITNDHIEMKSSDTSLQTAGHENLDCEYHGPDIVIGFSAPYVVEICNTLSSEDILIHLTDPARPGVFCPTTNEEGTDLLMVLMPMNVSEF